MRVVKKKGHSKDLNTEQIFAVTAEEQSKHLTGEDEGAENIEGIRFVLVDIDRITPDPDQPRRHFDADALEILASQIKQAAKEGAGIAGTGILQPPKARYPIGAVRDAEGNVAPDTKLILTMGERRWRAAKMAGLKKIPLLIQDQNTESARADAFLENALREDLTPMEYAAALHKIKEKRGLTVRGLAVHLFGSVKYTGFVQNRLDLLKVQPDIVRMVDARPDSISVARRIDKVQSPRERSRLIQMVLDREPSSRVIERVRFVLDEQEGRTAQNRADINRQAQESEAMLEDAEQMEAAEHDRELAPTFYRSSPATPGVPVVPAFNVQAHLDLALKYIEQSADALHGTTIVRAQFRSNIAPRINRMREALDRLEAHGS